MSAKSGRRRGVEGGASLCLGYLLHTGTYPHGRFYQHDCEDRESERRVVLMEQTSRCVEKEIGIVEWMPRTMS
jgi:hypothetical protein